MRRREGLRLRLSLRSDLDVVVVASENIDFLNVHWVLT